MIYNVLKFVEIFWDCSCMFSSIFGLLATKSRYCNSKGEVTTLSFTISQHSSTTSRRSKDCNSKGEVATLSFITSQHSSTTSQRCPSQHYQAEHGVTTSYVQHRDMSQHCSSIAPFWFVLAPMSILTLPISPKMILNHF